MKTTAPAPQPRPSDAASPWRTIHQAAAYLQVSRTTLYRMLREKRLIGKKLGRTWRFHVEELERVMGSNDEA